MKTKFTKGEWCIFNDRVGVVDKSDSQSHGMMNEVAYVDMYNFGECEGVANAHLIAAAPEMYEMLDTIRCFLSEDGLQTNGLAKEIAKIPELLAKARGEHE